MPRLDVSSLTVDPTFASRFDVYRRPQTVDARGRARDDVVSYFSQVGSAWPDGDEKLDRRSDGDGQTASKVLKVATRFRLRTASPGYQADLVGWPAGSSDRYIVAAVEDYASWGVGMILATCESIDLLPDPPE